VGDLFWQANQKQIATYLKGKENLFMYLLGRVIKETQGKASPTLANSILKEVLEQKRNAQN
jgi:Asp-tRNA(Asn)/Glu-tRNA(Gln) amidotransferase B subunit